ncbi:MAG: phosphatidate cytidylyltransferase [Rudaea sp.]|uniref:phosphatidate cytidylyltransferase n=1 Tax=Rudaea sp. TaxID=2136325 RepID=UPI0039E26C36
MKQRIITALLVTPFAIALMLFVPTPAFVTVIGAFCGIAMWEWTRLSGMRSRPWRTIAVAAGVAAMLALYFTSNITLWWVFIILGCLAWIGAVFWLRHFSFAASTTPDHTALKLVAGTLAILPAFAGLMRIHQTQALPHTWALYAMSLVWIADTFAYLAGSRWGKTKLAPQISPGKTWAGLYGALAGSGVVAAIGGWLLGVRGATLALLVLVALVSVAFSVVGDLFESLIKRHAGVKDSGNLFPGHGGVCDRLDGVFAALPFFALGKALLGL